MRRVVVYPGRIAIEAADIPAPSPDEALVRRPARAALQADWARKHGTGPLFGDQASRSTARTAKAGRASGTVAAQLL